MARAGSPSLARQLGTLLDGGSAAGLSDRQLIERFVARRDAVGEAAFAAIVARHGPMVLGVCRQLLGDRHHAEDAFQAVFLVLARRARSLRQPERLGNWLYGAALRTSRKERGRLARRRRAEEGEASRRGAARVAMPADGAVLERERAEALHREIERLPGAFRAAIVLCCVEGLSPDEAARRLRWPAGTLRSRLARAREKLRVGLSRRGVAPSGAALATALMPRSGSSAVSPPLCDATTRAAIAFTARHAAVGPLSASSAALARKALRSMLVHKIKLVGLSIVFLAVATWGVGLLARMPAETERDRPMERPAAAVTVDGPRPAPGRMTVIGHVRDAEGRPASGVPVDIVGTSRAPETGLDVRKEAYVSLGRGVVDVDGRFRVDAGRTSSARFSEVYALVGAAGKGSGFGCVKLPVDAEEPTAEITLRPEQVIRGRLVDVNGRPADGVEVRLHGIYGATLIECGGDFDSPGPGRGYVWPDSQESFRSWPRPVTTDARGRFAFGGVGRGLSVSLSVRDPRFAQQRFDLEAGDRDDTKEVTLALHPARIIEGRALAADTGLPIPDAVISVRSSFGAFGGMVTTRFRADDRGRFAINPYAGDYFRMRAFPPEGQPFLGREFEFAWPKGAVKEEVDLTLPRGVLLRGKVTEEGTGRPLAGASLQFFARKKPGDVVDGFEAIVASRDDGSFRVAVPPGKGYLMVVGPTLEYVPREIGGARLFGRDQPGGVRFHAHAILAYDVRPGDEPEPLDVALRPGKTLRGRVVGPDGEDVPDALVLTRPQLDPINLTWQGHDFVHARDGRFELHGFDPEQAAPAYFLDARHGWGAKVDLSGKQAEEGLIVRLRPCGRATARFVGPDGKPVAGLKAWPYFEIVMTPGAPHGTFADRGEQLQADAAYLPNLDPEHYGKDFVTDADGRVALPSLIPGVPYRAIDWSTVNVAAKGVQVRKDFAVEPGEALDLGDILVEAPGP